MKVHRFRGTKLHGYLDLDISFNSDLTFVTGINGSGKTSAVRAVTSLLTPSIRELANLAYKSVEVTIEHNDVPITIRSERSTEEISLECTGVDGTLHIPVLRSEAYEPRARFLEREHDFYREQEAVNVRNEVLVAIDKLPTPMFLDLERRHQSGTRRRRDEMRFVRRTVPANPLAGSLLDSLTDAQALAEDTYRLLLAERTALTDELKQNIILTAFELASDDASVANWFPPRSLLRQLERDEHVVNESLRQIGIPNERLTSQIEPFFKRVRDVASRFPSDKRMREITLSAQFDGVMIKNLQDWSAIQPQVRQINRLVELITEYNSSVSAIFEPIERYKSSVNGFLSDSGKELYFDQAGNLQVYLEQYDIARPITALSSGERQLVVILTHLAFNRQAKRANVLIIDEPELSLHLKWQEHFVDAVTSASPGLQLILATHSPSIIRSKIENCVDVEEARRSDRVLA